MIDFLSIFFAIDPDREQCVNFQKEHFNRSKESAMDQSSIVNTTKKKLTCKSSATHRSEHVSSSSKVSASNELSNKCIGSAPIGNRSTDKQSTSLGLNSCQQQTITFDSVVDDSCSIPNGSTAVNDDRSTFDDDDNDDYDMVENETRPGTKDMSNDIYLDKIKFLSLKVNQQSIIIKEKDALIKRLRSTMIGTESR